VQGRRGVPGEDDPHRKRKVKKSGYTSEVTPSTCKEDGSVNEGVEKPKAIVHGVLPHMEVNVVSREEKQEGTPTRKKART
jgi:hypothetical protein